MGRQSPVGEFEQLVLLSTLRLEDDAYGVTIRREIEERTGRQVSRGAVYTTLDRLETKGLLTSGTDGGGRKRFYRVTPEGIEALRAAAAAVRSLWAGLESVLGER